MSMSRIAESELIINPRGAIYHLDLRPEEVAGTVITVGDPDRVKEISKHFDSVEVKDNTGSSSRIPDMWAKKADCSFFRHWSR